MTIAFDKISNITIADYKSYQTKLFLTFDIDWCADEVLSYTLDIIEKYDIKATFFVTHDTPLLSRMRNNPNIELGIHPNFNFLLQGDFRYGKNIYEVLEYYLNIVPDAICVRSHSQTQNSIILEAFQKYGLKYCLNTFIPYSSDIILKPYNLWIESIIKIPYFWEDDVHCVYGWQWDVDKYLNHDGLKVFDFHPIHVFLNTDKIELYESNKKTSAITQF